MAEHTPTTPIALPISVNAGLGGLYLRDRDGHGFAMTRSEIHQGKLEHIVRCVNAHDELVTALGHIAALDFPTETSWADISAKQMEIARAALAKAKGAPDETLD